MNILRRSLCLLLCLLCIYPVFSTVANAETIDVARTMWLQHNSIEVKTSSGTSKHDFGYVGFWPHNGSKESDEIAVNNIFNVGQLQNSKYITKFAVRDDNGYSVSKPTYILKSNTLYEIQIYNIYHSVLIQHDGTSNYARYPELASLTLCYADGSTEDITLDVEYDLRSTFGAPYADLTFSVEPPKDVEFIEFTLETDIDECMPDSFWNLSAGFPMITSYFGETGGDKTLFQVQIIPEEVGLLSSLLEWIKSIKSKIDDTFESVKNGFTNVISNISNVVTKLVELPQTLWDKISEGLKALFVPTEEQMEEYSGKWDELLSNRFGAMYEATDVMTSVVNTITNAQATATAEGTIYIPLVSLNNFGIPFSFGGYDVDIVPEGFDTLITACKRVISIICTLAFINVLRKRYDSVMG